MTDKEITRFKHLLQDYKSYQQEINRIQEEIKDLEYKKHPYHSPSLTEPIGKTLSVFPFERVERINTVIEEKEKEIDHYMFFIQKADAILSKVSDPKVKEALILLYVKNQDSTSTIKKLGFSAKENMYRIIKKYLKNL